MSQAATKKKKRLGREELTLNLMNKIFGPLLDRIDICTVSWLADGI